MDERWVTIGGEDNDGSGQHVLIKENGTITAGFGKGRNVRNAFSGGKADTPEKRTKEDTSKNAFGGSQKPSGVSKLNKPEALIRQDKIKNAYTEKAKAFSKREDELIKEGDEAYKEYLKKKTKKNKAIYENKQSEIDEKMNALMKEWKEERKKYTDAYFKNQKTFGKASGTVREVYGKNDSGYEELKSILEAHRKQKRGTK